MVAMKSRLPSNGVWPVWPRIVVLQTSQIGVHVHHKAPVMWPILRYMIYPQGALVVNSLTIFNEVIMLIINVVIYFNKTANII